MRNPRRTAATSSALMIGLGLIAMVSILSASLKASFDAALQDTLRADLVLTSSSFLPFSQDVAARTADVDGVEAVSAFRQGGFQVNDSDAVDDRRRSGHDRNRSEPGTERGSHRLPRRR